MATKTIITSALALFCLTSSAALANGDSLLDGHQDLINAAISSTAPVAATAPLTLNVQDAPAAEPVVAHARFGEKGSRRFHVHGGYGVDVKESNNEQALLGVGISYFVDDNISLDVEFNGMYIDQLSGTAAAFNFNLLFRWHFYAEDTWSLYIDGGAGLFLADDDVPETGSTFNFTPQAGLGASIDIGNDTRMMLGVRWHHISNASLYDENPGRDSIMGYVGVSIPF